MVTDFKSTFGYTFNDGDESEILKTTLISTPESLASALRALRTSIVSDTDAGVKSVIGLDASQSGDGECIDGIRLATATVCFYIELDVLSDDLTSTPMAALCRFFQMPDVTFVTVGVMHTLDALGKSYGIRCRNFVDLGPLAAAYLDDKRLERLGLADLARRICQLKVKACVSKCRDVALFDRAGKTAATYHDTEFTSEWYLNSVVVNAHLAFMVGNRLLGGSMPYEYGMYQPIVPAAKAKPAP